MLLFIEETETGCGRIGGGFEANEWVARSGVIVSHSQARHCLNFPNTLWRSEWAGRQAVRFLHLSKKTPGSLPTTLAFHFGLHSGHKEAGAYQKPLGEQAASRRTPGVVLTDGVLSLSALPPNICLPLGKFLNILKPWCPQRVMWGTRVITCSLLMRLRV